MCIAKYMCNNENMKFDNKIKRHKCLITLHPLTIARPTTITINCICTHASKRVSDKTFNK